MPALHPGAVGVEVIRSSASGLADIVDDVGLDLPVPTCGDWTTADLAWHVCEVHDFWRWVIEQRPAGPDDYPDPARPAASALTRHLRAGADRLAAALDAADPTDPAWSWSDEQTVGFTIRRQSHEAVIHHVDGLLAAGRPVPTIDPELAADGVDEMLDVFIGGVPSWATFHPAEAVIRLDATDTGDSWTLRLGRMTGTSPDSGRTYDLGATATSDDPADTVISAPADALDLWLWGRTDDSLIDVAGDAGDALRLRKIIADATQ